MKIRTKLLAGILILFLVSQGISLAVLHSVQKDYEKTVLNQESLLNGMNDSRFDKQMYLFKGETMNQLEKETILKTVFRQTMGENAALYQEDRPLYNRTSYDFSYKKMKDYIEKHPETAGHPERIPVILSDKTLYLAYREVEFMEEKYQIYQLSDLSFIRENMKKNAWYGLRITGVITVLGAVLLYLFLKKLLSPLEELTVATMGFAGGNYKERAQTKADGEIGILTAQFNRMADKIEEKIESLNKMNEQQLRLIGSLSHEIRTPMTAIGGYTQMLRYRSDLNSEQKEKALMYMDSECHRISALTGKMMELCGLYQEKKIVVKEEKVYYIVRECLEKMNFRMKEAGVSAEITTENKEITYLADRDLFMSYVWNILENAVRASSKGEKIKILIEEEQLSIIDEGIGISEEDLDKVQEAFYMAEKSRSRKEGGAGLGLSLCSQIVRVHGASMLIESRLGKGTTVIWRNKAGNQEKK